MSVWEYVYHVFNALRSRSFASEDLAAVSGADLVAVLLNGQSPMSSSACCDDGGERWNGLLFVADSKPIPEIMPERQAELLACLHQPEHAVTRLSTVSADRAARDLPFDDTAAQISFRGVRMQRRFRALQHPQQFGPAALQP